MTVAVEVRLAAAEADDDNEDADADEDEDDEKCSEEVGSEVDVERTVAGAKSSRFARSVVVLGR